MYLSLHEPDNATAWKDKASQNFREYLEYITLSIDRLRILNPSFIEEYTHTVHEPGKYDWDFTGYDSTETDYKITELGYRYIEEWKTGLYRDS